MNAPAPAEVLTGEHLPAAALPVSEIVEYQAIAAGLADLRQRSALANFDLATAAGDKAARAIRAEHVALRTRIEQLRVAAKEPHLLAGRQIDAAAKFLTAEIARSEEPLDAAILERQRAKEAERAAEQAKRDEADRVRREAQEKEDADRKARIAAEDAQRAAEQKAEDDRRNAEFKAECDRRDAEKAAQDERDRVAREAREREEAERAEKARKERAALIEAADPWAALDRIAARAVSGLDATGSPLTELRRILDTIDEVRAARTKATGV